MLEFQEKRKIKRFFYSNVTLIFLIILIFLLLKMVWSVYEKQALTKDNLAKTATSFEGLQAREKMLSAEIERLNTEAGREVEIREKYGLVKPGEEVIVVVPKAEDDLNQVSTPSSFWQKLKEWLK